MTRVPLLLVLVLLRISLSPSHAYVVASAVRVSHPNSPGYINLSEVALWDASGVNCARSGLANASSEFSGIFAKENINDGIRGCCSTGAPWIDNIWHDGDGISPWVMISLPSPCIVASIEVVGRSDCCTDRDIGDTVELFDASGSAVFTSSIDALPLVNGLPTWSIVFPPSSPSNTATQTASPSPSQTASSSQTATSSTSSTPSASQTPSASTTATPGLACPATLFRALPRTDLVGTPVGTTYHLTSEGACRITCCGVPSCGGYTYAHTELRFAPTASCFLLANVTMMVPTHWSASAVLESTL